MNEAPKLSVVIPVRNEMANIAPLVGEIEMACGALAPFEIIYVNDGSTDGTRDTGCGLKCFRREAYLALPYFDALHRFMPALVKREGFSVALVDVVDRPRLTGVSNYGFFDRLWVGIVDLAGVRWLIRRRKRVPQAREV